MVVVRKHKRRLKSGERTSVVRHSRDIGNSFMLYGANMKVKYEDDNVYAEQLQQVFTSRTGLDTHL